MRCRSPGVAGLAQSPYLLPSCNLITSCDAIAIQLIVSAGNSVLVGDYHRLAVAAPSPDVRDLARKKAHDGIIQRSGDINSGVLSRAA